jgi:hypothetical protein
MASIVEISFDLSADPTRNFAKLDDAERGILGSTDFVLGGALLIDVTDKVQSFSISRGKSRQLDRYPAGKANIRLDNSDRSFDPLYEAGPYAGQILPRRDVRITTDGVIQYSGVIDDWNLDYNPNGASYAEVIASDAFTLFANQALTERTMVSEQSGDRIGTILSLPEVNWPVDRRNIVEGRQTLQADVIPANTNTLEYLQLVTASEPGSLFVGKDNRITFKDRQTDPSAASGVILTDDGSGIPYQEIQVVYGAELLYNRVVVSRLNGGTAIAENEASQREYDITTFTVSDLLMDDDAAAENLAKFLVARYSEPEYRFESLTVSLDTLDEAQKAAVLGVELGDVVEVRFTPNNIPPAIDRFVEIIRVDHRVTPTSHRVTFGLGALDLFFWRLSDPVFGRLSADNSLA